jgi:regulatory protein
VPDAAVVDCGLAKGVRLERPLLREIRRSLHRADALAAAGRTLKRRDASRRRVAERLARAGVAPAAREEALTALESAGVLDDERFARSRAEALADRGWGDRAIHAKLSAEGVEATAAAAAIEALEPEAERAATVASRFSDARKAWAYLARHGFDRDSVEAALGALDAPERAGLG